MLHFIHCVKSVFFSKPISYHCILNASFLTLHMLFTDIMNTANHNIKFTKETEINNELTFMDLTITRQYNKLKFRTFFVFHYILLTLNTKSLAMISFPFFNFLYFLFLPRILTSLISSLDSSGLSAVGLKAESLSLLFGKEGKIIIKVCV